jgi:hypothetical protein
MQVEKLKNKEKVDNQEKFAIENLSGVDNIAKKILSLLKDKNEFIDDLKIKREKGVISDDEYYDGFHEFDDTLKSELSTLITVLTIKLSTAFGHATSANSTKPLRMLVDFMDEYGIGSNIIHKNISGISRSRRLNNAYLMDLFAMVAIKTDDIEFIKYLESFGAKNKDRKNIYKFLSPEMRTIGDMDIFGMISFSDKNRIMFESLINGSKQIYAYFTQNGGLTPSYILRYIVKDDNGYRKLDKREVSNVLELYPELFKDIFENMPENLPQNIIDIFFLK